MDFESLIISCKFEQMNSLIKSEEDIITARNVAQDLLLNKKNILGYYACLSLLEIDCSNYLKATIHIAASIGLSMGLSFVNGIYDLGFYHHQKAMELAPLNVEYKRGALLFYADTPDYYMDHTIKEQIVENILELDPDNVVAKRYKQH